ncbi:Alpha-fetoprotein [Tupaia chinensis]|uniref:Alpha-fetoprotein n=1 Tax=Tupaia chinensis TaxID=246437 RepID=L9L5Y8_TUPCH|nr:Alpha-fetoprotein [Tupaia chinensis]
MKTVTLITFFVFFSYIKCQTFQRSLLDAAMLHINRQNYLEENLRDLTSIMVAQFLQKATYEEVQTIAKELLDLTEKCKNLQPHELPSECAHQLITSLLVTLVALSLLLEYLSLCKGSQETKLLIFKKFHKKELVLLTKKQPKADFSEIAKLTTDTKNLHQICCDGNAVACALGRAQLMSYICSNQAMLSSKITQCCEQPAPFRGECIINSENDRPALSSLPLSRFTEDPFVCKHFADKEDDFLQEFLYEYSRRHPELAVTVILRVEEAYKKELENCCKLENPLECYSHGVNSFFYY